MMADDKELWLRFFRGGYQFPVTMEAILWRRHLFWHRPTQFDENLVWNRFLEQIEKLAEESEFPRF